MNRRDFLLAGASLALVSRVSLAQPKVLRASVTRQSLVGAAHPSTEVWSYNASVPGPELRFKQGERLRVEVENALAVQTTVHWHGIRLPNAMDGVPGLTQAPIAANGGKFVYEFDLPDAGTYWYHPHPGDGEQLARGLYGALIVEERDPPAVDRDVVWILSDWRLDRDAAPAPGLRKRNGREPCRADRKYRDGQRHGARRVRCPRGRATAAAAHQRLERADLRPEFRRPPAVGGRAGRPSGPPHWFERVVLGPGHARRRDPRLRAAIRAAATGWWTTSTAAAPTSS